jgi:hypothetical protein
LAWEYIRDALGCQAAPLIIGEAQAAAAELLLKQSVLFRR